MKVLEQLSNNVEKENKKGNILLSLGLLLILVLAGLFLFQSISLVIITFFYNYSLIEISSIIQNPSDYPGFRMAMLFIQGFSSIGSLILAPYVFIKYFEKKHLNYLNSQQQIPFLLLILGIIIVFTIMPFNNIVAQWNQQIELPGFMEGIETWAKNKEEQLKQLTLYLTKYDNYWQLIFGIIVIGVIPGVGEELVFRGILQRKFHLLFKNIHIAIWVTGALFSFIHFQFFGFLPRMILGVLFGYLYYWSGHIAVPIICHFANNTFTLYMMYLYHHDIIETNVNKNPEIPMASVIFSIFITAVLLFLFKKSKTWDELYKN